MAECPFSKGMFRIGNISNCPEKEKYQAELIKNQFTGIPGEIEAQKPLKEIVDFRELPFTPEGRMALLVPVLMGAYHPRTLQTMIDCMADLIKTGEIVRSVNLLYYEETLNSRLLSNRPDSNMFSPGTIDGVNRNITFKEFFKILKPNKLNFILPRFSGIDSKIFFEYCTNEVFGITDKSEDQNELYRFADILDSLMCSNNAETKIGYLPEIYHHIRNKNYITALRIFNNYEKLFTLEQCKVLTDIESAKYVRDHIAHLERSLIEKTSFELYYQCVAYTNLVYEKDLSNNIELMTHITSFVIDELYQSLLFLVSMKVANPDISFSNFNHFITHSIYNDLSELLDVVLFKDGKPIKQLQRIGGLLTTTEIVSFPKSYNTVTLINGKEVTVSATGGCPIWYKALRPSDDPLNQII